MVETEIEFASSCVIPTTWKGYKLIAKNEVTDNTTVYDFELPKDTSLQLPTCACILALAPGIGAEGADVVRPYTPFSPNSMLGRF